MIKVPTVNQFKINIKLHSGELFENKDITNLPLTEYENWVSFWYKGKIRAYPIQAIEYYELVPEETEENP